MTLLRHNYETRPKEGELLTEKGWRSRKAALQG